MCGIFCTFSPYDYDKCKLYQEYIKRRGPNYYDYQEIEILNYKIIFSASVLWLQGKELVKQPIVNDKSVFVFNGDIFGGAISDQEIDIYGDTTLFLSKLENFKNIASTLSDIQGPYAFIYLDKQNFKIYFARDLYGRRSLLIGKIDGRIIITSVATKDLNCIELPAIGFFSYDLKLKRLMLVPWSFKNSNFSVKFKQLKDFLCEDIDIEEQLKEMPCKKFRAPNKAEIDIFNLIKSVHPPESFQFLLNDSVFRNNVITLCNILEVAISKRISTQPKYCKQCIIRKNECNHALIGVLFSGGVDCTVLALLSDKFTEKHRSIDLINVAFEKGGNYNTPDRETGLRSFEELRKLRPDRHWNFIEVNVQISELDEARRMHIRHLIHPLNSILDDSLGCALWFASRGRSDIYEVPCRVLLVGMGADELFGGYTRHRAALKRFGWLGLHNSLNEDWENIAHRNLARDDRVVSDHGRQLRTPYLDENLVKFARELDCWQKTYPSEDLPTGLGDKILLRTLAYYLGLHNVSTFKKRALQFGSRIANSKENANDVSPRL